MDTGQWQCQRKQRKTHHKVKTGCKSCKIRRQKCDEASPICSGCRRHSTECLYPTQKRPRLQLVDYPRNTTLAAGARSHTPPPASPVLCRSPPPALNMVDLELFHQYITSTCIATGQRPEMTIYGQTTIPQLGLAYPFVMRGIFAMAATHLSRLRPSRQAYYSMLATKNRSSAIPEFRAFLQIINKANCDALVFYSKSLLWCSFAGYDSSIKTSIDMNGAGDWLPEWFHLLRGSCRVVELSRPWLEDGPHVPHKAQSGVESYLHSPDDNQIAVLMSQMIAMTESTLCMAVISTLRETFALASLTDRNTPLRNAMNHWVGSLPDDYVALLKKDEPWALVVLAYFCVLAQRSETVWFMEGHGRRLMRSILLRLDPSWRHYVQWPSARIGVEMDV